MTTHAEQLAAQDALISETPVFGPFETVTGGNGGLTPLTENLTWWVSTAGDDENPGSRSQPFKTGQRAADLAANYDFGIYNIYVKFLSGSYPGFTLNRLSGGAGGPGNNNDISGPLIEFMPDTGATISFTENPSHAGNIVTIQAGLDVSVVFANETFDASALTADQAPILVLGSNVWLGDETGGTINYILNESISSGDLFLVGDNNGLSPYANLWLADNIVISGGNADYCFLIQGQQTNVHVVGTVTFSAPISSANFAFLSGNSLLNLPTANLVNPGNISGVTVVNDYSAVATDVDPTQFPGGAVSIDATSSWSNSNVNGGLFELAGQQKSGAPAAGDLIQTGWGIFKDTSGGGVYLAYNDAGTIKKVALT